MRYADGWWIPGGGYPDPVAEQLPHIGQIPWALTRAGERAGRRVAVQAGARVGLWPKVLAEHFERVISFEADPVNFACAEANLVALRQSGRVDVRHAALGPRTGTIWLQRSSRSDGLHHVVERETDGALRVAMATIDELELEVCDAIFLDVEGYELEVLKGARETLARCRPLLVIEENQLCQRYGRAQGDVVAYLADGYELVAQWPPRPRDGRFRGSDLLLVPRT